MACVWVPMALQLECTEGLTAVWCRLRGTPGVKSVTLILFATLLIAHSDDLGRNKHIDP